MVERARMLLELGKSCVLDATWAAPSHRDQAERVARATGAAFVTLCCDAPADVAERRVARRIAAGSDISMATVAVARQIASAFAPWPQAARLDTATALADTVAQARETIRLAGLTDPVTPDHTELAC
jgi:hypothetical protein